jgi:hypothetical protein
MEKIEAETKANLEPLVEQYISQLTKLEQKTCKIAQEHLESSFNIEQSIGFLKYKESLELEK